MEKHSKRKLLLNLLFVIVVICLIVYVMKNSLGDILRQIGETDSFILLLIICMGLIFLFLEGMNYQKIAYPFMPMFSLKDGFFVFCYGAFYRVITFGSGTLVAEIVYLKGRKLSGSQSTGIMTIHMMLYKLGMLCLSVVGFIGYYQKILEQTPLLIPLIIYGLVGTGLLILFLFLVTASEKFHQKLFSIGYKIVKKEKWIQRINNWNEQILSLRKTVRKIMTSKGYFIKLLIFNIFRLLPWYCIPFIILSGDNTISLMEGISYIAMTSILAGVLPSPAGIGSFELVYMLMFTPIVGEVDAASSLLLYRFVTYVLPFLVGMFYVGNNKKKDIQEEIQELHDIKPKR